MRIIYRNLLPVASVSCTNENASKPVKNLWDKWRDLPFASNSTSSVITAEWTEDQTIDSVAFANAQEAGPTGIFVSLYDSTDASLATWTLFVSYGQDIEYFAQQTTVRKAVITLSGASGFELGILSLGEYVQINKKAPSQGLDTALPSVTTLSRGGQVSGRFGTPLKSFTVSLLGLSDFEFDVIQCVYNEKQGVTPWLLDIWQSSHDVQVPLYVVFASALTVTKTSDYGTLFDVSFDIQEVR
jgi:hypothetical protein